MKMYNEFVKCQRIYILFMFISLAYGTCFTECQPNCGRHSVRQTVVQLEQVFNKYINTHTHNSHRSSINRCRGTCANFIGIFKYVLLLCTRCVYAMLVASLQIALASLAIALPTLRRTFPFSPLPVSHSSPPVCLPACLSICLFVCPSLFALKQLQWWHFQFSTDSCHASQAPSTPLSLAVLLRISTWTGAIIQFNLLFMQLIITSFVY